LDNNVHHVIHDRELFWSFIDAVNYLVYTANTVSALVQAKTRLPESEKGLLYYRVTRSRTIALNISYNIADRAEACWADLHSLGQGECATQTM
jgi:hypothetical protein